MDNNYKDVLQYKGQPMVRDGNKIYFGDPSEKYILVLTIIETVKSDNKELPSRIIVQVQDTDPALALKNEKIVKQGEKKSLYDAIEIGLIWLERELKRTDI
jgi:hypothetical protein